MLSDGHEFFVAEGDPEQDYAAAEEAAGARDRVRAAIAKMDARQRAVVERRLLRDDEDQDTLNDIGKDWGVCRERIRQLERQVLGKMKEALGGTVAPAIAAPARPRPRIPNVPDGELTITQAAEYIQKSVETLRRLERDGKITPARDIRNFRRYTRAQLDELANGKWEEEKEEEGKEEEGNREEGNREEGNRA